MPEHYNGVFKYMCLSSFYLVEIWNPTQVQNIHLLQLFFNVVELT